MIGINTGSLPTPTNRIAHREWFSHKQQISRFRTASWMGGQPTKDALQGAGHSTGLDRPRSYGSKRFLSPPTTSCQQPKAADIPHVHTCHVSIWKDLWFQVIVNPEHDWDQMFIHTRQKQEIFYFSGSSRWLSLELFCSHFTLVLWHARSLRISDSSWSEYRPCLSVYLRKWLCIIFVNASANCAPVCTHLSFTPSDNRSLIALAWSWVRNSWQLGGAVLVTRS